MNSDTVVFETLTSAGLPIARMTWGPHSYTPPLPYGTYEALPTSDFADSANYPRYRAKVYTASPDDPVMDAFREAIASLGTYVLHIAEYDEGKGAFMHECDFSLVRGRQ